MNYSNKLQQKLAYLNFRFPKTEIESTGCLQLNQQYIIVPITIELLDKYPPLKHFLISCYTDNHEFSNLFGIDDAYAKLLDQLSKDKVILEFYHEKAKKNRFIHDVFITNYVIVNQQRKPVGVIGTCDYEEFPQHYTDLQGKKQKLDDRCIFLAILVAKKYRRKGLYKLGFNYFYELITAKNLHCCQFITFDNEISQKAARKIGFELKGSNAPKEDFKKEIFMFEK